MQLQAEKGSGNYIQSAEADAVLVEGRRYRMPLIIASDRLVTDWQPPTLDALTIESFAPALALDPEVILLGTGASHRFAGNRLMTAIMSRGVGFEVMANDAACRTYNILNAEDRRVVVALLA